MLRQPRATLGNQREMACEMPYLGHPREVSKRLGSVGYNPNIHQYIYPICKYRL